MKSKITRLILIINVGLLCIPIVLVKIAGIEAPLSDLTLLFSVPVFFFFSNSLEKILFSICMFLSLISIYVISMFYADYIQLNAIVSFIYFFRPYFIFFLGYYLIKETACFYFQFVLMAKIFAVIAILILLSIILSGKPVRIEGELTGSILGFPIFATYGVNSLAVLYVVMFVIIFINLISQKTKQLSTKILFFVSLASLIYLIIGSSSREALLGFLFFLSFYTIDYFKKNKIKALSLITVFLYILTSFYFKYQDIIDNTIGYVVTRSIDHIKDGQWDDFSSGRISLFTIALNDILKSPFFGVGFYGFNLFNNIDLGNSSPHNQYITSAWKMGILASAFYFAFLYRVFKKANPLPIDNDIILIGIKRLSYVFVFVFCSTWDILMVPNVSMIFMFLLGTAAKVNKLKYNEQRS